jgi:hypothetical protein
MTYCVESRKLFELRAKTDRQLVELITRMLDRGISWALEGKFVEAEQVYADCVQLVRAVRSNRDRLLLEGKIAELEERTCGRMGAAC